MKWANITKCSKKWWNNEYTAKLETYCNSRFLLNWKNFRKMVKKTKQSFFDKNIQEVILKNKKLWELIIGSRNINSWHQKLWSSIVDCVSNSGKHCTQHSTLLNLTVIRQECGQTLGRVRVRTDIG